MGAGQSDLYKVGAFVRSFSNISSRVWQKVHYLQKNPMKLISFHGLKRKMSARCLFPNLTLPKAPSSYICTYSQDCKIHDPYHHQIGNENSPE